jgi:hypothetical protein
VLLGWRIQINPSWAKELGSTLAVRICIGGVAFVVSSLVAAFALRILLDGFPDSIGGGPFSVAWSGDIRDLYDRLARQERLVAELADLVGDQERSLQAAFDAGVAQALPPGPEAAETEQQT